MAGRTRRQFLQTGAGAAIAAGLVPRGAMASPFGLPLGLQLYSVRELLPKDYEGTLKQVAALGYREVEAAGFYNRPPAEVKEAMRAAGLRCVSAHYAAGTLYPHVDEIIAFHKTLGAEYIICSSPRMKDQTAQGGGHGKLSIEDWRWNAEQFNTIGKQVKAAGMHFGYHNHTPEFAQTDGLVPYDELLRLTDPALVTFELDCGWVKVGGADPEAYLRKHADRISMLHVKDFQPLAAGEKEPHAAELGHGTTDFKAIFAAASKTHIKHCFVEQEQFNMAPMESLKVDAEYMKSIRA